MKTPLTLCALALATSCGHHDTPLASYYPPQVSAGASGSSDAATGRGGRAAAGAGGSLSVGAGGSRAGNAAEAASAGEAPGLLCPDTYTTEVAGLTSRYREGTTGQSWVAAERDCELDGGHLIVIDSEAENAWLASVAALAVTNDPSTHQLVWLGASDTRAEGEFGWVTGMAVTTAYWNTSEPEPNSLFGDEDCVEIRASGQWNDDRCNAPLAYVCECDGESSSNSWCDSSADVSCGDCSTVCPADQSCVKQQCQ